MSPPKFHIYTWERWAKRRNKYEKGITRKRMVI